MYTAVGFSKFNEFQLSFFILKYQINDTIISFNLYKMCSLFKFNYVIKQISKIFPDRIEISTTCLSGKCIFVSPNIQEIP